MSVYNIERSSSISCSQTQTLAKRTLGYLSHVQHFPASALQGLFPPLLLPPMSLHTSSSLHERMGKVRRKEADSRKGGKEGVS